jgi:signal transduction histidine kinase
VVIGRRATVLERDRASSRWRILLTTIAMAAAAAVVIRVVLNRTLSAPLAQIMTGVRSLGGPEPPRSVRVPRSAGELRDLGLAFNEMAERLEGKRAALMAEAEERIALERRLRSAEKFAALGRLSGGLAHELGSPLNAIEMRAERIEALASLSEETRRQAREIVAEVDRIAELIEGLRHVSRDHAFESGPVDLSEVVQSAVRDTRDRATAAAIAVRAEAAPGVMVRGDGTLLRHAIANLLMNAVQALEHQPGERLVRVRVYRDGGVARVRVEDTGAGVPPGARSRLFEPFFTTRDVGEGMGLGLAISRSIIEEHGGELRIEDRPGGGTRVCLSLPLDTPPRMT